MNTGLLLEVLFVSFVLILLLSLFTLHYSALTVLLLNEKESYRILKALAISDNYVSNKLSLVRLNTKVNNLVDCSRLSCEENLYVRCGPFVCGNKSGKLIIKRPVVYNGAEINLEVGVP